MKKLIVAEKPSVGKEIANVLGVKERKSGYMEGEEYIITWCFGHLVSLSLPDEYDEKYKKRDINDLPIFPTTWKYRILPDKKDQFQIIKLLMDRDDVKEIIEATDAGREGELIFRLVYEQAGCKKPFKRLWINSMEEKAIRNGFEKLLDSSEKEYLATAAVCRAQADWLVGMNISRLFQTPVGRVKTPTLALVVNRELAIKNFVQSFSYSVSLKKDNYNFESEKFENESTALDLEKLVQGKHLSIATAKEEDRKNNPPKLFDLVSLQREANKLFGLTAKETLDIAQSLYETKLLTYPRTDSNYITKDMEESTKQLIPLISQISCFESFLPIDFSLERIIDNSKVSDHHALLPTEQVTQTTIDKLKKEEKEILFLVISQLFMAISPPERLKSVSMTIVYEDNTFTMKKKKVVDTGYTAVQKAYLAFAKAKKDVEEELNELDKLELLSEGTAFLDFSTKVNQIKASPPKSFTEDTLLAAMERAGNEDYTDENIEKKGIGTPATMGGTIEDLVEKNHFLKREKKKIIPTENGFNLIKLLPDTLTSAKLTASWETFLQKMERGEETRETFIKMVHDFVSIHIAEFDELTPEQKALLPTKNSKLPILCKCPRCDKGDVLISKKAYFCSDRETCGFILTKAPALFTNSGKTLSESQAQKLIEKKSITVKGLISKKTNKPFDAKITLDIGTEGFANFNLEFMNNKKKNE